MDRRSFLKLCAANAAVLAIPSGIATIESHIMGVDFGLEPSETVIQWWTFDWKGRLVRFAGTPPEGAEIFKFPEHTLVRLPEGVQ